MNPNDILICLTELRSVTVYNTKLTLGKICYDIHLRKNRIK